MPKGKPAGVRCIQLTEDNKCKLFGKPDRPRVCSSLNASEEQCGQDNEQANKYLTQLEELTIPDIKKKTNS
jgi:hypothetical protein